MIKDVYFLVLPCADAYFDFTIKCKIYHKIFITKPASNIWFACRFCVSSNCFTLISLIIKYRARKIIIRLYCLVISVANFISRNELIDKVNHDYVNWCTYTGMNLHPRSKWSDELNFY